MDSWELISNDTEVDIEKCDVFQYKMTYFQMALLDFWQKIINKQCQQRPVSIAIFAVESDSGVKTGLRVD